jgi:integrase
VRSSHFGLGHIWDTVFESIRRYLGLVDHVSANGSVFLVERKRGPVWYAKWRIYDPTRPGEPKQIQRALGPAWMARSRPAAGFLTRKSANAALDAILVDARREVVAAITEGVTFARAADEWLRHGEYERQLKPSTLRDYRSAVSLHLIPTFGHRELQTISPKDIEQWLAGYIRSTGHVRQARKLLAVIHGIFERARRVWDVQPNPAVVVDKPRLRYDATEFHFFSPEEVWALARAAENDRDAALFLTAAFAGLRRGECLALRWRDIDFERQSIRVQRSISGTEITVPKSGRGRVVPMAQDLAQALARLADARGAIGLDDLVFAGDGGTPLDGSALRRRYKKALGRAGLRDLRFHDLRHTIGSLAIQRASIIQVQAWLGHADVKTTARYLHYKSQAGEADLLAQAFAVPGGSAPPSAQPPIPAGSAA